MQKLIQGVLVVGLGLGLWTGLTTTAKGSPNRSSEA